MWMQVVATSATISKDVLHKLYDIGFTDQSPYFNVIAENEIVPANIKHNHMCVGIAKTAQIRLMFQLLRHNSAIVVIPRGDCTERIVEEFKELDFRTMSLSNALKVTSTNPSTQSFADALESGEVQLVVANEDEIRGMDFPFLDTAYLTFSPSHSSHYVHIAGRVGRRGQPARVITLLDDGPKYTQQLKRHQMVLQEVGVKTNKLENTFNDF